MNETKTKTDIIAALDTCSYAELEEIAATAQGKIDEAKAQVLAQAQQMGIVKPRKPRGNAKHADVTD